MSKSKIEWTDASWNPTTGCTKVSAGCKNCYAKDVWENRFSKMPHTVYFGRKFEDVQCHPERLEVPLHWRRGRRIFVDSMSDLFHDAVPEDFIDQVFGVMALCPQHTFQVLTKRSNRMREYLSANHRAAYVEGRAKRIAREHGNPIPAGRMLRWPLPHVWIGVSVEDQDTADARIPLLLETPAAVRWLSIEPLLGAINLRRIAPRYFAARANALTGIWDWEDGPMTRETPSLDWVVVGGESGQNARPMHPEWARSLRDQCKAAGVAFNYKQWGEWVPRSSCYHKFEDGRSCADIDPGNTRWPGIRLTERGLNGNDIANVDAGCDAYINRVGKRMAGRLLDGVLHDEYPTARGE